MLYSEQVLPLNSFEPLDTLKTGSGPYFLHVEKDLRVNDSRSYREACRNILKMARATLSHLRYLLKKQADNQCLPRYCCFCFVCICVEGAPVCLTLLSLCPGMELIPGHGFEVSCFLYI